MVVNIAIDMEIRKYIFSFLKYMCFEDFWDLAVENQWPAHKFPFWILKEKVICLRKSNEECNTNLT